MSETSRYPAWPGWETVGLIGKGSFGAVYEIRRQTHNQTERAAMKVISIPQSSSEIEQLRIQGYDDRSVTDHFRGIKERIEQEYLSMLRLKGATNIVYCEETREVQHDDGVGWDIYIRMELLTPLLKTLHGPVDDALVIRLGRDMCRALAICQAENIIHRDIKPENIFVSRDGTYKLGDFGVARTMEGTGSASARTGTYRYMAPEVYFGEQYGPKADQYSLGMVLYWMLNGFRSPFLTPSASPPSPDAETVARQRRFAGHPLPPPATGSIGLKRIVLKACAFDPRNRYQSADAMLADLEALSRPDNAAYDRPNPAAGGGMNYRQPAVAGRAGAYGQPEAYDGGKTVSVSGPTEPPKSKKRLIPALLGAVLLLAGAWLASRWIKPDPDPEPSREVIVTAGPTAAITPESAPAATPEPAPESALESASETTPDPSHESSSAAAPEFISESTSVPSASSDPTSAPIATPEPTTRPTTGVSASGTKLMDIEYTKSGKIKSLSEKSDGEWIEWKYVYGSNDEFLYRKRNIGTVSGKLSSTRPAGTGSSSYLLSSPVDDCVGFTLTYHVTYVRSNSTCTGTRDVYIKVNSSKWEKIGSFEYPKAKATEKNTFKLSKPYRVVAVAAPRRKEDNSHFNFEYKMTNVWVADYEYVEPVPSS